MLKNVPHLSGPHARGLRTKPRVHRKLQHSGRTRVPDKPAQHTAPNATSGKGEGDEAERPAIAARRSIRNDPGARPPSKSCETLRVAGTPHSCAEPPGKGNLAQGQPLSSSRDELAHRPLATRRGKGPRPAGQTTRVVGTQREAGVRTPSKEQVAPLVLSVLLAYPH